MIHAKYLLAGFGDVLLSAVTYAEIRRYYTSEQARGRSRETCRKRLSTLRMALQEAIRMGWLDKMPPWVVIKGDSKPRNAFWTLTQWEAAHLACDDEDLRTWVALAFWTGMHTSDLNRYRWQDVDLVRRTWIRRNTKSKAKPLELPLPDRLWAVLDERHKALQPHSRDLISGRPMGNPNRVLKALCFRADVTAVSPIDLRRSCETFLAEKGTAELFQTTWLGLRSPRMLWRHYMRVTQPTIDGGIALVNGPAVASGE